MIYKYSLFQIFFLSFFLGGSRSLQIHILPNLLFLVLSSGGRAGFAGDVLLEGGHSDGGDGGSILFNGGSSSSASANGGHIQVQSGSSSGHSSGNVTISNGDTTSSSNPEALTYLQDHL